MRVLHAGAGGSKVPHELFGEYKEVTLDIDPDCKPDMVGSMVDMDFIPDETFEAAYTSHTLEHLYPHEVRRCIYNFNRVLKKGGMLMIVVPNLKNIKPTEDIVYLSPSGPICGLDMIYGKSSMVEERPYMAHHCGFVKDTLKDAVLNSGFEIVEIDEDDCYNLTAIAVKN